MQTDSSDSEDDGELKKFLEAADTTLLTNALYETRPCPTSESRQSGELAGKECATNSPVHAENAQKSQRHLPDEDLHMGGDLNLPEAVQQHIAKKLSALIQNQVEFCTITAPPVKGKRFKSKVKLLSGADCYVKAYEEFAYESQGPQHRPVIKRRNIDGAVENRDEQLMAAAVDGVAIVAGADCKHWTPKPERPHKVFRYKADSRGALVCTEPENEFTQLRRKNKWNESKIKQKIKR